jgi:hypothetical protein
MDERVRKLLDIELHAEEEARYWRSRGDEPSQHTKDVLARCAEIRAAGLLPPKGTLFVAKAPSGRSVLVTREERATLLRAGARDESGDA